jgi:hypothetical protein
MTTKVNTNAVFMGTEEVQGNTLMDANLTVSGNESLAGTLAVKNITTAPTSVANTVQMFAQNDTNSMAQLYCQTPTYLRCITQTTFGMCAIFNSATDYSTWALSTATWTLVVSSPAVGTWYKLTVFNTFGSYMTTTSASGITIVQAGIYLIHIDCAGVFSDNKIDVMEVTYSVNGTTPPNSFGARSMAQAEMSTTSTYVNRLTGLFTDTLAVGNVISVWIRYTAPTNVPTSFLLQYAKLVIYRIC